jgi:phospholipase C
VAGRLSCGISANYHCSLLGPTWPNRFYFAAGTSGGITTNGVWGYGVFDYPIILDLLDAQNVSWGVYNMNWDSVPLGNTDNVFVFWKNFAHDQRTLGSKGSFLNDARMGKLPEVSWLVSSFAHQKDEHPPADVSVGMSLQEELINAVRESPLWQRSAYLLTYDEHGGFFDHVAPPRIDAYGLSVPEPRVRQLDANRAKLRSQRCARAAARWARGHQRAARPLLVLGPA